MTHIQNRLLTLTLLACLALLTACGGNSSAIPEVAGTAQPEAPAFVFSADARQAILNSMQLMIGRAYQSQSTITSDTFSMQITGEFNPPDQMRIVSQIKDGPASEMIVIGGQGWQKTDETAAWTELVPEIVAAIKSSGSPDASYDLLVNNMTEAALVGPDFLDGVAVVVYTMTAVYDPGGANEFISHATLWIEAASGLPLKQEVNAVVDGVTSQTVQLLTYPAVIQIEAPAGP